MAKATSPIFTHEPLLGLAQATLADALLDTPVNFVTVVTGNAEGTRIDLVRAKATVVTTAGMLRLFIWNGTNSRLIKEIPMAAITPSATVESFEAEWTPTEPIVLPDATWELRASISAAEATNIYAFGGHFG